MSRAEAVEAATRFARDQGLAVDRYRAEAALDDDTWHVHFLPGAGVRDARPGDFFTVVIDGRGAAPPRIAYGK